MKKISPVKIVTDGAMTGTAVITSPEVGVQDLKSCSFQYVFTGTPNGTFDIEGSVDGVNFESMGITIAAAAGAAGNRVVDITDTGVAALRAKYTNTSSTGTLQIWFCGKAV